MAEIAENLHRRELTKLERSELHTRWVEIVKVRELPAPFGGVQPNNKGIRAAARDLGEPEKNLRQSVAIAGLTPEAKDAASAAGLDDNQSALLEAAKAPPEKQVEAIQKRAVVQSASTFQAARHATTAAITIATVELSVTS